MGVNDDLDLAAIEARAAAATSGPWTLHSRTRDIGDSELRIYSGARRDCVACVDKAEDGVFLVHARQDIDALCQEVRRLRDRETAMFDIMVRHRRDHEGSCYQAMHAVHEVLVGSKLPPPVSRRHGGRCE